MAFLFALNAYSILLKLKMDTELPQYNTAPREISLQIDKKIKKHILTIKALTEGVIFDDLFVQKIH